VTHWSHFDKDDIFWEITRAAIFNGFQDRRLQRKAVAPKSSYRAGVNIDSTGGRNSSAIQCGIASAPNLLPGDDRSLDDLVSRQLI
jgi:hypothetical protein